VKLKNLLVKVLLFAVVSGSGTLGLCQRSDVPNAAEVKPDPSWPNKPLRIVVGFPAGSSSDNLARMFAERLSKRVSQPILVENKPGLSGNLAVEAVARATDGHTIGLSTNGPLTTSPVLYRKMSYDVAKDLVVMSLVASSPLLLVASTKSTLSSIKDYQNASSAKAGGLNFGSVGIGSGSHLATELLMKKLEIKGNHVPFAGYAQLMTSLVSGDVDVAFVAPSAVANFAATGRVKILGASARTQMSGLAM
jgi:tripartite-type tricarboxylate transporter receptor subunit TctC